jgi:hypothetical protein
MLSYMKDGTASAWAECYTARPAHRTPNLAAGAKTKASDYNAFIDEFKENFKEHNKGQVVCLKLDKLKQGKYSVDTYNKTFNDLATNASYNDEALIHIYMQGLNGSIHSQIAYVHSSDHAARHARQSR